MAELTRQQKKEFAKILYTKENLTQEEIADRTGVSRVTVNRWITGENWKDLRASVTMMKEERLKDLYRQFSALNDAIASRPDGERFATPAEADTIAKYAKAIEKLEGEVGLSDVISVLRKLLAHVREYDLEEAKRIAPICDSFVNSFLK